VSDIFETVLDVVSGVLMISGALLALTASLGLFRLATTRARMHATTKPATFGVLLCGIGAALQMSSTSDVTKIVVIVVLQLVTAPIGAHMLGRAVGGK
jgi:multicomponent Na+:H+ antiporter subunit G